MASVQATVLSSDTVEHNAAMFCGPRRIDDPTGTGLVVDGSAAIITAVLPDPGIAYRWGEFRVGDEILSISGIPYKRGESLSSHLIQGKDAYLVRVRRRGPEKSVFARASAMLFGERVWETEEQVAKAWEAAGDHHRGIVRGAGVPDAEIPDARNAHNSAVFV